MPTKPSQGIPTAEQEALQAPGIDPTQIAGLAAGFGVPSAAKMLFSQILLNAALGHMNVLTRYPLVINKPSNADAALRYGTSKTKMSTSGVPNSFKVGAKQWLTDKMLQQEPGSRMDKFYSTILEKISDWGKAPVE